MTPQERKAASTIAMVMRATRRQKGMNQVAVAKNLGISQSALSKLESGLLVPSAPQWFMFCDLMQISPDSLVSGYVDRCSQAQIKMDRQEGAFRIPNRLAEGRGSKVRAMRPFTEYFKTVAGADQLDDFLASINLEAEFFVQMDNQLNLNFCLDISRALIKKGFLKIGDLSKLSSQSSLPATHGCLNKSYENQSSPFNRVKNLIEHAHHYECNFEYGVLDEKRGEKEDRLTISVTPANHLSAFQYKSDPDLGDFFCRYKKEYFSNFVKYGGQGARAAITEHECLYQGADRCVYEMTISPQ